MSTPQFFCLLSVMLFAHDFTPGFRCAFGWLLMILALILSVPLGR